MPKYTTNIYKKKTKMQCIKYKMTNIHSVKKKYNMQA